MPRILMPIVAGLWLAAGAASAQAATYEIDPGHTFVTFQVSHIGFSWIPGRFNEVTGDLTYDPENPANSSARFTVKTASLDTGHAERDKHLREKEGFFEVGEYPEARFVSTDYEPTGEKTAKLKGKLTIKGVTRPVTFRVEEMGAREDPWGDFRRAFSATTTVNLEAFDITYFADEGIPLPKEAEVRIAVEALRQ